MALEVDGVRDASNEGLLYWNNSGRYDDLPTIRTGPDRRMLPFGAPGGGAEAASASAPTKGILD